MGLVPLKIPHADSFISKINGRYGSLDAFVRSLRDLHKRLRKRRVDKMAELAEILFELVAKEQPKKSSISDRPASFIKQAELERELRKKAELELKLELENLRKAFWSGDTHRQ